MFLAEGGSSKGLQFEGCDFGFGIKGLGFRVKG